MKKKIAIIFNDVHLKTGNEKDILNAFKDMVDYAVKNDISNLIFAGDLFDSRSYQRQELLLTFDKMLHLLQDYDLTLYMFPGNHDKTVYKSYDSFLEPYKHYPNVIFNRGVSDIEIGGVKITLLPFFSDDMLVPMIESHEGGDVLISHFEMQGSTHLGDVSEKADITKKMLKKWNKTYLGHYHNWHEITKDIVHLPAFIQDNFGETDYKGYSVLHDDLTYEIIEGNFKKYIKLDLHVDDLDSKKLSSLISEYSGSKDSIRFEISGDKAKLKSIDKSQFKGTGIDVKIKFDKIIDKEDVELTMEVKPIQTWDASSVRKIFVDFCKEKGYTLKEGQVLLEKFLKQ